MAQTIRLHLHCCAGTCGDYGSLDNGIVLVIIICLIGFQTTMKDLPVDISNQTEYNNFPIFCPHQNDKGFTYFAINGVSYKAAGFSRAFGQTGCTDRTFTAGRKYIC